MTNKDILIKMIDNLNENGINLMIALFQGMDENEKYNRFTTLERLSELQQIEKQEEEKQKAEAEAKRIEAERKRIEEEKEIQELLNKHSRFLCNIKTTKPGNYWLTNGETNAIYYSCKGSSYGILCDSFRAGFLKGQRAEKARQKGLREKARAC